MNISLRLSDGRKFALASGAKLNAEDLPGLHSVPPGAPVAIVSPHPTDPSIQGLQNLSQLPWKVHLANGDSVEVKPGKNVRLAPGTRINFGAIDGAVEDISEQFATRKTKAWLLAGIGAAVLCLLVAGGWYFHHRAVVETARREQMAHEQEIARERERSREQEKKRQEELAAEAQRDKERLAAQRAEEQAAQERAAAEAAAAATPYPTATPSHEFDGTWTGRRWVPPQREYRLVGGWFYDTVVVQNGTVATFIEENTSELEPDMGYWSDIPAPYNRTRQFYRKFKADADRMQVTDTSIEIWLNEWQLVDWKPKNFPAAAFLNTPYPKFRHVFLSSKNNDELAISWIDGGDEVLRRMR